MTEVWNEARRYDYELILVIRNSILGSQGIQCGVARTEEMFTVTGSRNDVCCVVLYQMQSSNLIMGKSR